MFHLRPVRDFHCLTSIIKKMSGGLNMKLWKRNLSKPKLIIWVLLQVFSSKSPFNNLGTGQFGLSPFSLKKFELFYSFYSQIEYIKYDGKFRNWIMGFGNLFFFSIKSYNPFKPAFVCIYFRTGNYIYFVFIKKMKWLIYYHLFMFPSSIYVLSLSGFSLILPDN